MCTVTYLPTEKGYILTHNRDEHPSRASQYLITEKKVSRTWIYPRDPQAHGSWIFIHSGGLNACLINGAFENHEKRDRYKMSRGNVLMDLAHCRKVDHWLDTYDLDQVEPFTLIICYQAELIELIWDGQNKHINNLGTDIPTIWSSSTLYTPDIKQERKKIFYEWIDGIKDYDPAAWIYRFHEVGSIGDLRNNILMRRKNGPQTISTAQVILENGMYTFKYHDQLNDKTSESILKTKKINLKSTELSPA